jgi:REP element-mobilizing transposase RayT
MGESYTQLYLHLVWATWDRMPLVTPELRDAVYGCILEQVKKLRCEPIAIGGMEDHVHLLLRLHPTARISEVVQHAKGASSHLVTQELDPGGFFKWQGHYGAFTLSKQQVPHVRDYILRQEEHHHGRTPIETLERIFHRAPHPRR